MRRVLQPPEAGGSTVTQPAGDSHAGPAGRLAADGRAPAAYTGAKVFDVSNADCDWDHFDSDSYFEHN